MAPLVPKAACRSPTHVAAVGNAIDLRSLHPTAVFVRILGINYVHVKPAGDDDLYVTSYGIPLFRHLLPENWLESTWFADHRQPLLGTASGYRVQTKPIDASVVKTIDLVVKWSRVGQEVPLDTFTLQRNINAEFNSPFEEFALVNELRASLSGDGYSRVLTQKPLAIYVPAERMQLWQTGRCRDKLLSKERNHPGVLIDVLRAYVAIYGWIDGIDAVQALSRSTTVQNKGKEELEALTQGVDAELRNRGFIVSDHKPAHFVVRMHGGSVRRRKDGTIPLALVDYELLARTRQRESLLRARRRSEYLIRQRDRFEPNSLNEFPQDLRPCRVLGVDYVVGPAASTNGTLWVVGNDAQLHGYFLPERWRGHPISLSETRRVFYSQTKDRIHLVWRISPVGEFLSSEIFGPHSRQLLLAGYNCPFEEFALALRMSHSGIKTVCPRAIYLTGGPENAASQRLDERAFHRMRRELGPDGQPVLSEEHDYITIWGYWRGLCDEQAVADRTPWSPISADQALAVRLINEAELATLISQQAFALNRAGLIDSNLKPDHLLLSYLPGGHLKRDQTGEIEVLHCNCHTVKLAN